MWLNENIDNWENRNKIMIIVGVKVKNYITEVLVKGVISGILVIAIASVIRHVELMDIQILKDVQARNAWNI